MAAARQRTDVVGNVGDLGHADAGVMAVRVPDEDRVRCDTWSSSSRDRSPPCRILSKFEQAIHWPGGVRWAMSAIRRSALRRVGNLR